MNERLQKWTQVFGPAWLVMIADIDIASIITALQSGASWGYRMVFVEMILILPLFFIQDAAGRLGTVGGWGLGEAIYRFYGKWIAIMAALPMAISDFLEYVAEYAGIAIGLYLLGLPIILGLAAVFIVHTAIVLGRRYRKAELLLLPISFLLVVSIAASTLIFHLDIRTIIMIGLSPIQPYGNASFDYLIAANTGAVIMPWMLYFHSGADSRKKLKAADLKMERLETLIGAVISEVLMSIIVLDGMHIKEINGLIDAGQISAALSVFGGYASIVMGIGFIAAGFLALVVVSLGSAWGIMDALNRRSRNSFIKIYLLESAPALLLVILVNNYVSLMITLMVIYTIIIIPSLFFLGRLTSNQECMNGKPLKRYETAIFWVMSLSIVVAGITGIALIV